MDGNPGRDRDSLWRDWRTCDRRFFCRSCGAVLFGTLWRNRRGSSCALCGNYHWVGEFWIHVYLSRILARMGRAYSLAFCPSSRPVPRERLIVWLFPEPLFYELLKLCHS